ncbi:phosphate acyltransferase PlsX [uncultured Lentibacter sp.]|jgi:glycerol-3-phosphate acyltransferase PlsX|uniref:phosphate acyltransferase PlsX n=1 Tax=uncultured Lentibacter sp. TaxID=1659309 RepID=UPI0026361970|nr:phosphate acyltransferase PlsX [uncultured Lentibacter sp.]
MSPTQTPTPASETPQAQRVVISVDAMGSDKGPAAIVAGCSRAAKADASIFFLLHGQQRALETLVAAKKHLQGRCQIIDAPGVVSMEDKPAQVMRTGKQTSMWSALESVRKGEATVCVSCGNTGALMALSVIRLRKIPGVYRPAIAVLWPSRNPQGFNVMLDAGADIRADERDLLQYALMGASYARNGLDIARPRVGLLNVGTEEFKGRAEIQAANDLIAENAATARFDYVGFVEGSDLPGKRCDVIVTDGFTGNIALKTGEGTASLIRDFLREAFNYTPLSRLAALLAYTSLKRLSARIDPRRVNGGVFLGLNGTVVKSHGSADATGVSAAIKLAVQLAQSGFNQKLAARISAATMLASDTGETETEQGDSAAQEAGA